MHMSLMDLLGCDAIASQLYKFDIGLFLYKLGHFYLAFEGMLTNLKRIMKADIFNSWENNVFNNKCSDYITNSANK